MFTGIVEEKGRVMEIEYKSAQSIQLSIAAEKVVTDVSLGDSIAINGICLTVTQFSNEHFQVDVMPETMKATSLANLSVGSELNLERSMSATGRFGGHFVTGHVDYTGEIMRRESMENAIYYDIYMKSADMSLYIMKGSVAVDGVSLTIFAVDDERKQLTISLIPHTVSETVLGDKSVGDLVNIEADMLAKLVHKQTKVGNQDVSNN